MYHAPKVHKRSSWIRTSYTSNSPDRIVLHESARMMLDVDSFGEISGSMPTFRFYRTQLSMPRCTTMFETIHAVSPRLDPDAHAT